MNFQDRDGETDFYDDTPGTPVTLWIDQNGIFLGLGGSEPEPPPSGTAVLLPAGCM